MEKLNQEYMELFGGEGRASEKFWALEERIRKDRKKPGVEIELRRSEMCWNLLSLLRDGMITLDDLDRFSDDTMEFVLALYKRGISAEK